MFSNNKQQDSIFNPALRHLTSDHIKVSARYDLFYAINDALAGVLFVIGSIFFFWSDTQDAGTWLFLIGSILFTVRPGIKISRNLHLRRVSVRQNR
ncbi:YrhK family protein [Celerinatantimonas yamalensis]|uniref:YrhK family protein n=1 Tax=Celerinatantimonas yamalensis TaxID=559956 RepID=A0ABW9G611_9GAMM